MALAVLIGLSALLLVIGAAFAWQERHAASERAAIYGVEDSIVFVDEALSGPAREDLDGRDVRRILEWSVRYLQDPSVRAEPDTPIDFAGNDMGRFIQDQALAEGHGYNGESIRRVLDLQAAYLAAIGAVGGPAADEPVS